MSSLNQIDSLLPLLDSVFRARQADLAKVNARINTLNAQLESLEKPVSTDLSAPAQKAGANDLWKSWVQDRRKLVMQELALAYRDRENIRFTVAASLSKLEAAKRVKSNLAAQASKSKDRSASW